MKIKNSTNIVSLIALIVLLSMQLISCGSETDTVIGPKLQGQQGPQEPPIHNCSNPANPNCDER